MKIPTGCGKTRFLEHMAFRLQRPLITIACHEDLTTSDLVGRYPLKGEKKGEILTPDDVNALPTKLTETYKNLTT